MSAAIGGSRTLSRKDHGDLWVDVRDFGAKADNGITDNAGPIQAAIDYVSFKANANYLGLKGIVYIPSALQAYFVKKSIWVDTPNIEIRGEGWGSRILMLGKHSVFYFGIRRKEYRNTANGLVYHEIDTRYRPDLFGKLDASAVTQTGKKWGLRTNGNSFAQFQACSLSSGPLSLVGDYHLDNWSETDKLTIEFCIEAPDGQEFQPGTPLLGMGNPNSEPSPWMVTFYEEPNKVLVLFRTKDVGNGRYLPNRVFGFRLGAGQGPFRIAIQFDLRQGVFSAFVNGTQVSLIIQHNLSPTSPLPLVPGTGITFSQNEHYPFMIGTDDISAPYNSTTGIDLRLYGLRLSNTIRYRVDGPGRPQVRIDAPNAPINDAYAYFGQDENTIAFLPFTDDPSYAERIVSVSHGNQATFGGTLSGLFLNTTNAGGILGNAIRDLMIISGNGGGQSISLGGVLEMVIENVRAQSAFNAIGTFIMYANYMVYVRDCWLDAYDAPYFGAMQLSMGRDNYFGRAGRVSMRHVGCNASWENGLIAQPESNSECIIKCRTYLYGGNFNISNLLVDYEGYTLSQAGIYCETMPGAPATSLLMRDIFFGSIGRQASLVMLRDLGPEDALHHKCYVAIENMQAYTSEYIAAIDVDGPLWYGEVSGFALTGPQFLHRGRWGSRSGVVVKDLKFTGPPRQFAWFNGAHVLLVRTPAEGQFSEWRCVATGAYGTPNPPIWMGMNAIYQSTSSIASYVTNHAYFVVTLS